MLRFEEFNDISETVKDIYVHAQWNPFEMDHPTKVSTFPISRLTISAL